MENTDQPSNRQCRRFQAWGLAAAGSALITVGCAQPLPKYVASSHGPQAQLVMRGNVQPGETYGVYLFQDPLNCGGMQQVGVGIVSRDPETTSIAAGLTTAEVFLTKANRSICRVRWSFEPVVGHRYLVSAASTPTGCSARILDATDPRKIVPEPSSRRRDVGARLCVPLAQTTTLADAESRAQAASESDLPIVAPPRAAGGKPPVVSEDDLRELTRSR